MSEEENLFKNRLNELSDRAYAKGVYAYSDFLNTAQQSLLLSMKNLTAFSLYGGYEGCERAIAVFGNEEQMGYMPSYPVDFVKISPINSKFADNLTHRDFLGSLTGLGLKREKLGDIIINDNCAYVVCHDTVSGFIIQELNKVKHTNVRCENTDSLPDNIFPEPDDIKIIISSERLDVLVSAVYNLSRNESKRLIESERVYIDSVICTSTCVNPSEGSMISVRGKGRFMISGIQGNTRKGRYIMSVKKY